jgi:hypothetical protein
MLRTLAIVLFAIGMARDAGGAVIASYNLNSNFAPTSVIANTSATNIGQGGGLSQFDINGNRLRTRNWEQSNLSTARSAGDFVTFTVTPNSGFEIDLDSLTFDEAIEGVNSPTTFQVGITVNGNETLYTALATGTGSQTITPLGLSDITTSVEVRVYAWGGGTTSQRRWFLDNIVLNGAVAAIPEPSAWLQFAAAAISVWAFRRRSSVRRQADAV